MIIALWNTSRIRRAAALGSLLLVLLASPAWALIQALIPLQTLIDDSEQILLLEVDQVDPKRPSTTLLVKDAWKGKAAFERLPVNLTGDKEKHAPKLLKRIAPKTPVIAFLAKQDAKSPMKSTMMLAFTEGTWFQVIGTQDGATTRWAFTHCETYLRRTYKGTTAELQKTVKDVLAGKAKAPPPDTKAAPGFGPEIEASAKPADGAKAQP